MTNTRETSFTEIEGVVERAKRSTEYWRYTESNERIERLRSLRRAVQTSQEIIVETLKEEVGKPALEAWSDEVGILLTFIDYWIKNAESFLVQKIPPRGLAEMVMLPFRTKTIRREALGSGIVNVISPWNNPIQLALTDAVEVLVSGNVPILKPSEKVPKIGALLREIVKLAELEDIFFFVEGGPDIGKQLIATLPYKSHIAFTGSSGVGKWIKEMCYSFDLYAHIEGGGSDQAILVLSPRSPRKLVERAVNACVAGRFRNCGANCNAVKGVIVVTKDAAWANQLARDIAAKSKKLDLGLDTGNIFSQNELALAKSQLVDALEKGATCFTHNEGEALSATSCFPPVVLYDVTGEMRVLQEEVFAPILPIRQVPSEKTAIDLLNESPFGLDAYIFTENIPLAEWMARRLEVGGVCINDVMVNFAMPDLPFGDPRNISFRHGIEGVLRYTRPLVVVESKKWQRSELHWPHYDEKVIPPLPITKTDLIASAVKLLVSGKGDE